MQFDRLEVTSARAVRRVADQLILLGNSVAGYVQTQSGRRLTIMVAADNTPVSSPADVEIVTTDQARMAEVIQQSTPGRLRRTRPHARWRYQ